MGYKYCLALEMVFTYRRRTGISEFKTRIEFVGVREEGGEGILQMQMIIRGTMER